jgi:hypothetical protein
MPFALLAHVLLYPAPTVTVGVCDMSKSRRTR